MGDKTLLVNQYLGDEQDELEKEIDLCLKNRSKLHITAPIGSGKTRLLIETIIRYKKKYQFIVLEPLISITSQVSRKLNDKDVSTNTFNSNTYEDVIEYNEHLKETQTQYNLENGIDETDNIPHEHFLSTIDSAWRLLEEGLVNTKKTVILIDESHSFLQEGRENFDKTVFAILDSGCPIIGFSGTASSWVNEFLFDFDENINVEKSNKKERTYQYASIPIIPKVIAKQIDEWEFYKTVIWVESIKTQQKIKEAILLVKPEYKVVVLNRESKINEEKDTWSYLMENEKFPKECNVLIINKVAQAGINILDDNIDGQIMVDRFDLFGFIQYSGRCRNYDKSIFYYYNDYGENPEDIVALYTNLKERISAVPKVIEDPKEASVSDYQHYKRFTDSDNKIKYRLQSCNYANEQYDHLRDIKPSCIIKILKTQFMKFKWTDTMIGYVEQIREEEVKLKKLNIRKGVPDGIVKYYKYLMPLIGLPKSNREHREILDKITNSTPDKKTSKTQGKLFIPKTIKVPLIGVIKMAKGANISINRLIVASYNYSIEKNKEKVKSIIDTSIIKNPTITKHIKALEYFEDIYANKEEKKIFKHLVKEYTNRFGKCKTPSAWESDIKNKIVKVDKSGFAQISADQVYKYLFKVKDNKITIPPNQKTTGTSKKQQNVKELVSLIETYKDFYRLNNIG